MYSNAIEIENIPPKQNVEYYRKVQKTTSRTVYEDGKKPQHKVETKTYVQQSNNLNQKSGQLTTSNYRNNISGSKYNSSYNQKNQSNSKNYQSNSQSYTFNSKQSITSNKISNSKNSTYVPTRTNNFANKSQRSNNESRSYNKEKYSFAGTLKGRSNNTNSNIEYRNKDGSQVYKSEPKPFISHERIIIRIQSKRKPRKGDPVENFEYHESKEIKKNNKITIVSHRRWGDPFYQLIDRNKKYSSLTVGTRAYRYSTELDSDDYSKARNRTIDTDDRNHSRFRNTTEDRTVNLSKYNAKNSYNKYQTRTTDSNNENKYRFNNSTEDRTTNASKYGSKYTSNQYQNRTNSSRGTTNSQNYNNIRTQKQDTLNSRDYNTQTQGSQSTNYANYKTLTQNTRGTLSNKTYGNNGNNHYNESYKRIQMTEQVDERRRYNSNRGYEGRFTDISKKNDSYMNRRGNSNTNTSINRNQYDINNRGKSNDNASKRNQYTIDSKRIETRYNNVSNIGNQKRNLEPYKRDTGISIDTDKYKRGNAPTNNRGLYEKTTEVRETRQKYTSGKYEPNQNKDKDNNERQNYNKYGRGKDSKEGDGSNKYGRGKDSKEEDENNKYGRGSGTQVRTYESKYASESYNRGTDNQQQGDRSNKYGIGKDSKEDGSDKYGRGTNTQVRTYESKYASESYNRGTDNQQQGEGSDKYGIGKDSKEDGSDKYGIGNNSQERDGSDKYGIGNNSQERDGSDKYGRGTDTQVRTYESNQYIRESNKRGTDNEAEREGDAEGEGEEDGTDNYGRGSGSQVRTYESNQYVSVSNKRGTDNEEEEEGNRIDGKGRDSKGGAYGTDEFGRPRGMDSNMQNQQTEELYQKEKMMYSQQVNDDGQQQINKDSHFCPVHGYHNIYDDELQNNNQFAEDQKEINQYERREGIDQRYGIRQGGLSKEQAEFERRQREYLQRQYQQNQGLNQRFTNNMKGYEDGQQRYEYMQQQINNTQGSINIQGQDNLADNYRFYESKYITSSSDNTNILNQRNYMSNMSNQSNIHKIKLNNTFGRGSAMSQGEVIDLSKIYIATKVTPVYSEIIEQQFQNLNCCQTQVCNICGNPYDDAQLIIDQQKDQSQGVVYNPYPIQGEMMEQQAYGDY